MLHAISVLSSRKLVSISKFYLLPIFALIILSPQVQAAYTVSVIPQTAFEATTTNVVWENTNTGFPDDDDQQLVPIGFNFSYGGVTYTQVRIVSNGLLHFGADQAVHQQYINTTLAAAADRLIMPYWDDLEPSTGGSVTYDTFGSGPNRRFVATWNAVPRYNAPATSYTIQVVLYENGDILFRYGNDDADGSSATIGLEETDADFNQFSFNAVSVSDAQDLLWQPQLPSITRVDSDCLLSSQISVIFSAPVSPGIVDDVNNYSINNGVTINSATLVNPTTVLLDTSGFSLGTSYILQSINPSQVVNFTFGVTTFSDLFSTSAYSNNDGSSTWSGDWLEDQEIGGGGGPSAGNITIAGGVLRMDDRPNSGGQPNLSREVDLSGQASATLSFDFQTSGNLEGSDVFNVDISNNGGASYTTLRTYSNDVSGTENIDITAFISGNTRVRFRVVSFYGGPGESMEIDNVTILAIPDSNLCISISTNHLSIGHDGTAVNCQAENVTISAHTSATAPHVIDTLYTGTVNLSVDTLRGDWACVGGCNGANLINLGNGAGSYVFDGSESGTVTLTLANTFAETIDIDADDGTYSDSTGIADGSDDPPLTFSPSGFNFLADSVVDDIGIQIAGKASNVGYASQVLELEAINTNTLTGACEAALNGVVSVDFAFECDNPDTCQRPIYILGNSAPEAQVAGTNTDVINPLGYTAVDLDFGTVADTTANFVLTYPDAGQIQLHARYVLTPSNEELIGGSNSFVSRPFGFRFDFSPANPAATGPGGGVFTSAGTSFQVDVTGILYQGADDADNNGSPDNHDDTIDPGDNVDLSNNTVSIGPGYQDTPNFGQEFEDVDLSSYLFDPNPGFDPGLSGTTQILDFTAGSGFSAAVTFNEVGIIEITAAILDGDYLGIGISETLLMQSRSGYVGRFTPQRLTMAAQNAGTFVDTNLAGAPPFTYVGQNFGYGPLLTDRPSFRVTARNAGGGITTNYTGVWAMLGTPTVVLDSPMADGTKLGSDAATLMALSYTQTTSFTLVDNTDGSHDFVFAADDAFNFTKDSNSEVTPFNPDIDLGITSVADDDGIATPVGSITVTPDGLNTEIRFGRIRMENAFGSELVDLIMPYHIEFYNEDGGGNGYWTRHFDADTTIALTDIGEVPGDTDAIVITPTLPLGKFDITLMAPISGTAGVETITIDLNTAPLNQVWLRYDWVDDAMTIYDDNPFALATFGIFGGDPVQIYIQQIRQ